MFLSLARSLHPLSRYSPRPKRARLVSFRGSYRFKVNYNIDWGNQSHGKTKVYKVL